MTRFTLLQPLIGGCLLFLILTGTGAAQEAVTGSGEVVDVTGIGSPRETMNTFLQAMSDVEEGAAEQFDRAITTLDLSRLPVLIRVEKGQEIAWMLYEVLERNGPATLNKIPRRTTGKPYLFASFPQGDVAIVRQPDGRWLFGANTIEALPSIFDNLPQQVDDAGSTATSSHLPWHLRLRAEIPDALRVHGFLLEHWQWIGLFVIIALGVVADKLTAALLLITVRLWRRERKHRVLYSLPNDWLRPLGLWAMAGVWWVGVNALSLPREALLVLLVAVKILVALSAVWSGYRVVDFIAAYLGRVALKTENKLDDVLVPLIRKTLKVFVTVVGMLFIAANLNLNLTSLLAGLGLGGLAFALAAKDMVQNLFGSITVLLDQSFHVGDWVVIGEIEGTVEEVGLRSTRIRTFYNSEIIMPNSRLITASIDNMGKRRFRRMKCMVSLTYDTAPDQVDAFCEGLRELVRLHPFMRKDYFHVYLNEMSASSLDLLVYVFWETPDWGSELRERHRFLLDILRLANQLGIELAFPTQTLHIKPEPVANNSNQPQEAMLTPSAASEHAREAARLIVAVNAESDSAPPAG